MVDTQASDDAVQELRKVYELLHTCLDLRQKYMVRSCQRLEDDPRNKDDWKFYPSAEENVDTAAAVNSDFNFDACEIPGNHDYTFGMGTEGFYNVYQSKKDQLDDNPLYNVPGRKEFLEDLNIILETVSDRPTQSLTLKRLQYLESKWKMYILVNEFQELVDSKCMPYRDFYNVYKVDTHIHHDSSMTQMHLLRSMKTKLKQCPDEIVIEEEGKQKTLKEVFEELGLSRHDLNIDNLDTHAHRDSFNRFDNFLRHFNPVGQSKLRDIFMGTDNYLEGKYLAEISKEVISDLEVSKYQAAEYRLTLLGTSKDEWDKLAKWVVNHKIFSPNVRWLIQIPRLYQILKDANEVDSFHDIVRNAFEPLFEVTQDPSTHPELHILLQRVVGFDSVDDESLTEEKISLKNFPTPDKWNSKENPPYSYYIYYMYANIVSLNGWRKARGFSTFVFRPHSGEAGDTEHLASAFLTAFGINHGILLRNSTVLEYLYYLAQIGIAMAPLSNNVLFLTYDQSPFHQFFQRGLNVSLSTDDPLQFHFTRDPLMEEYAVAAQMWKLSSADMCEIARNSVIQSGWENCIKEEWIGKDWYKHGAEGNDMKKTNIPDIRLKYRQEALLNELDMLRRYAPRQSIDVTRAEKLGVLEHDLVGAATFRSDLKWQRSKTTNKVDREVDECK
ncbi:hypothetical protein BDA99DRAFT_502916 [Phascolomyces articulosus]|uniref:AMP deaminase n=1 Tax=Phascolomyces articulosus TaxID=60185 RepID=A0AAD5PG83_9FUNG|nr:hypothetical protein BDA99DRAFT_502916 [Phascolomyces articulosus]